MSLFVNNDSKYLVLTLKRYLPLVPIMTKMLKKNGGEKYFYKVFFVFAIYSQSAGVLLPKYGLQ